MPKDTSPRREFETQLKALVENFDRHRVDYLRAIYPESQVRLGFIDPFFEALGWDGRNRAGPGPKDREVVVERGETSGRPDYNFRLDGRTAFFVEAKAPHVPLERTDVIMLDLHKQKRHAASESARARIAREIHVTDEQTARPALSGIDALVDELP